jgi:hypothetical protein
VQISDIMEDIHHAAPERYFHCIPDESTYKWAEKANDLEALCEQVLGVKNRPRTELFMWPAEFISKLETDKPFFLKKTMFLIEGEVRSQGIALTVSHTR